MHLYTEKVTQDSDSYCVFTGLGTSTSIEAKEYFSDMKRHRILFKYTGDDDDKHIQMVRL